MDDPFITLCFFAKAGKLKIEIENNSLTWVRIKPITIAFFVRPKFNAILLLHIHTYIYSQLHLLSYYVISFQNGNIIFITQNK